MREIKFRAWFDNRMLYNIQAGGFVGETAPTTYSRHTGWTNLDVNTPVMQYTGLKDKNGKEIYEGDITNEGVVKRFDGLHRDGGGSIHPGFYFEGSVTESEEMDYHTSFDESIEVIGNIYETPELVPNFINKDIDESSKD